MTGPFDPRDETIAPKGAFTRTWTRDSRTDVASSHSQRAALAMEVAHQLARRLPGLVLKGGTPLNGRIGWPPPRASIDNDLEHPEPEQVLSATYDLVEQWQASGVYMDDGETTPLGLVTSIHFPRSTTSMDMRIRLDISTPGTSACHGVPFDAPEPWSGSAQLVAPSMEAHAAQKLLLAAPPPFGRDTQQHIGRQNAVKDLFDLHSLGALDLASPEIQAILAEEVTTKSDKLGQPHDVEDTIEAAARGWERFAHPPGTGPDESQAAWRAYERARGGFRVPIDATTLRIAAGCARHALLSSIEGMLDWQDSWRPLCNHMPRAAWVGQAQPGVPTIAVHDDYSAAKGLAEAWAPLHRQTSEDA